MIKLKDILKEDEIPTLNQTSTENIGKKMYLVFTLPGKGKMEIELSKEDSEEWSDAYKNTPPNKGMLKSIIKRNYKKAKPYKKKAGGGLNKYLDAGGRDWD